MANQKIITFSFIILGILSLARTIFILWNSHLPDFSTRYDSIVLLIANKNPYTNTTSFTPENYSPSALTLLLPLSLFSFSIASKLWIVVSILAFIVLLGVLYKLFPLSIMRISLIFLLAVVSFPFKFTLGMGQINIILLFFIVLFLVLLTTKKRISAALAFSLAIVVKLFPVIYMIAVVLHRQWKVFFIGSSFIILLLFLPVIFYGKEVSMYYLTKIFFPLLFDSQTNASYYNQSITGFLSRLDVSSAILISRIFLVIVTLLVLMKKRSDIFLSVSMLTVLILLINNFTWQHHLILLLIPYYFLISIIKNKYTYFLIFISYLLIAVNIKNPHLLMSSWYGNLLLSHGFFGMLILWLVLIFDKKFE